MSEATTELMPMSMYISLLRLCSFKFYGQRLVRLFWLKENCWVFMNIYDARFLKIAKFGLSGQIEMSIITFRTCSVITRSNHCTIDFFSDFLLFILDQ